MPKFPRTNTAYNLASEYCTLQRILDYQQVYFEKQDGKKPLINTNGLFKMARDSFHTMADEFKKIMQGDDLYLKQELIIVLRKYAADQKLVHFRVSAYNIIDDFNDPFPIKIIQSTGDVLNDYFKDGFIVAHDFVSTANHVLRDYIDPALLIQPEEDKVIKEEIAINKLIPKIKTKFTVGQLAYLFRLLYDNEFTHAESLADLAKFIAAYFKTNRTEDIDIPNLKNLLSTPAKKDADKVADWLKELMIKARNFEVKPIK